MPFEDYRVWADEVRQLGVDWARLAKEERGQADH